MSLSLPASPNAPTPTPDEAVSVFRRGGAWTLIVLLAASMALGLVLGWRYAVAERQRGLQAWQMRLGIVADSRREAIVHWLAEQRATVDALAQNTALRLYLGEILASGERDAAYQESYLTALLDASAERGGFAAPPQGPAIAADLPRVGVAGLALTDRAGRAVAASAGAPHIDAATEALLREAGAKGFAMRDIHAGPAGRPAMAFAAAVFGVQADPGDSPPIGFVLGVKPVDRELYPLLGQPGEVLQSAASYLVRKDGAEIVFLSPPGEGVAPFTHSLSAGAPGLAEAFATSNPGDFGEGRNHRGEDVLVASRAIPGTPWVLVRTVAAGESLGPFEARGRRIMVTIVAATAAVALCFLLVWRHATALKMARAAAENRALADRLARTNGFLNLVTDSQPTAISVIGEDGRYRFANKRVSELSGIPSQDLIGKSPAAVFGPARVAPLGKLTRRAREAGKPQSGLHAIRTDGAVRQVKSDHIPLPEDAGSAGGVLVVEEDITEIVMERARRETNLEGLVAALLSIIDRRDPYSAEHSVRVAKVAEAIAREMEFADPEIKTTARVAALMNLGKIFVPRALLTKTGSLDEGERALIRDNLALASDLLKGVDFDGPVAEAISQVHAHWDGTGQPEGLAGDDILAAARIVNVANVFVGMVSPRAWRDALPFDVALDELTKASGRVFDRRPVIALSNILDNRGGRALWAAFSRAPQISSS